MCRPSHLTHPEINIVANYLDYCLLIEKDINFLMWITQKKITVKLLIWTLLVIFLDKIDLF